MDRQMLHKALEGLRDFAPPLAHHKHVRPTITSWRVRKIIEYLNVKQLRTFVSLLVIILMKWEEEKNG
jgi:hypothetical protein